ncbi:adenylate/guanylate cyclase domain-containing protein [Rhizobiaceae bacterium n13]|uniref:Adenylate/guanylate cyclase domain-containing protein n=1 Tax=Ferirhizobium litorale TaxID=2927786 RepID=A0AAE3U132_9HYPH|nr:adenylate/guanylate cyclase domain-containing protein [Fererhizobium litorale]MDI7861045.1 adenylate/guanylate cyclase domain-containing protein [Fererhizobium litorale]MDI7921192.1 adenylate/guanylate cyclase domain-containing protein [Fererhizobium litorale]
MAPRIHLLDLVILLLAVAAGGGVYAILEYGGGALVGATYALFMCLPILALERGLLFPRLYHWVRAQTTPVFFILALLITFALMTCGSTIAGILVWATGLYDFTWDRAITPSFRASVYALVLSLVIVFVLRVRELLGRDVFASLLSGRYRRPTQESRVFLFVDLADSTTFAERHGDLRTQEYLGAIFASLAEPVRRHNGAIVDYVGDCAIITWPLDRALKHAECVECVFDIFEQIEADSAYWIENFGETPRLRAALHGGAIITAEIGVDRHKITFFGDTVNTTSRIEGLCKTLGRPFLMSSDLFDRISLPATVKAEYLGEHSVKGRGQALGVYALSR